MGLYTTVKSVHNQKKMKNAIQINNKSRSACEKMNKRKQAAYKTCSKNVE